MKINMKIIFASIAVANLNIYLKKYVFYMDQVFSFFKNSTKKKTNTKMNHIDLVHLQLAKKLMLADLNLNQWHVVHYCVVWYKT